MSAIFEAIVSFVPVATYPADKASSTLCNVSVFLSAPIVDVAAASLELSLLPVLKLLALVASVALKLVVPFPSDSLFDVAISLLLV
ncbi:hypothetical protein [Leuconostoc pseudomesenteroides]|uniref:hypothetical protein n=1 Tax=Leuconostoc pseudomesenteroides TaxID=33968 RepID=UPI0021A7F031|nr:hypothetical protein [Leuconostoc pseudomesenteroides]MCT4380355.1 hypothetical protein [Leuconostoc pseudomesenteroides]